jgi:hypothetical protein
MNHFTDQAGFNAVSSQQNWHFVAHQPTGSHPFGAYFTTLSRGTRNLAQKLRIPKSKTQYVFEFNGNQGLQPLPGGRGAYVFFSATDYDVDAARQIYSGLA